MKQTRSCVPKWVIISRYSGYERDTYIYVTYIKWMSVIIEECDDFNV